MNYRATIDYLYNCTPQFQRIGAAAYKPGLDTVRHLAEAFGNNLVKKNVRDCKRHIDNPKLST